MKRIGVKGEIVNIELPKLTDEVIADLWHQSGCHLYKFAKMLRDWLEEHGSR